MQVIDRSDHPLLKRYEVLFSREEVERERDFIVDAIRKTARIDGFRQGKVPIHVVHKSFKDKIATQTEERVKQAALDASEKILDGRASKSDLAVIGVDFSRDDGTAVHVEVELYPILPSIDLHSIKLRKFAQPSDEAIQESLAPYIERLGHFYWEVDASPDAELVHGRSAIIDFEYSIDGQQPEFTQRRYVSGSPIKSALFDDKLLHMKAGEIREFDFSFTDYLSESGTADLVKVHIRAHLRSIFEAVPIAIDSSSKPQGDESLRYFCTSHIKAFFDKCQSMVCGQVLTDALVRTVDIDLPPKTLHSVTEAYIAYKSSMGLHESFGTEDVVTACKSTVKKQIILLLLGSKLDQQQLEKLTEGALFNSMIARSDSLTEFYDVHMHHLAHSKALFVERQLARAAAIVDELAKSADVEIVPLDGLRLEDVFAYLSTKSILLK